MGHLIFIQRTLSRGLKRRFQLRNKGELANAYYKRLTSQKMNRFLSLEAARAWAEGTWTVKLIPYDPDCLGWRGFAERYCANGMSFLLPSLLCRR